MTEQYFYNGKRLFCVLNTLENVLKQLLFRLLANSVSDMLSASCGDELQVISSWVIFQVFSIVVAELTRLDSLWYFNAYSTDEG